MAIDLAALKAEVQNDPASMGYVKSDNHDIRVKINDPALNSGSETGAKPITVMMLMKHLDRAEALALSPAERWYVERVCGWPPETDITQLRAVIVGIFGGQSSTAQGVAGEIKPLSRAEVLWGEGTVVTRDHLIAARKI